MKLFMEVNPQLFDECTHDYTEQQSNADAVKANRQAKWDRLSQMAEQMKAGHGPNGSAPPVKPPQSQYSTRGEDADPLSRESQQRMAALRLQDDRERERRPKEVERLGSSGGGTGSAAVR